MEKDFSDFCMYHPCILTLVIARHALSQIHISWKMICDQSHETDMMCMHFCRSCTCMAIFLLPSSLEKILQESPAKNSCKIVSTGFTDPIKVIATS